jgi:hypothetical protein
MRPKGYDRQPLGESFMMCDALAHGHFEARLVPVTTWRAYRLHPRVEIEERRFHLSSHPRADSSGARSCDGEGVPK